MNDRYFFNVPGNIQQSFSLKATMVLHEMYPMQIDFLEFSSQHGRYMECKTGHSRQSASGTSSNLSHCLIGKMRQITPNSNSNGEKRHLNGHADFILWYN